MPHPPARPLFLWLLLAALLGAPALSPAPAAAATLLPLTLEDLESRSSDVVVGTVLNTRAGWDAEHRFIETTVRIRVDRRVKGKGAGVITVVVPGGVVGDVGMKRPGSAVFTDGEEVLLFAEPKGPQKLRPVGMFQGKMAIARDAETGAASVLPAGPAWGARGEPLAPGTAPDGPPPPLPLDEVLERLGGGR